MPIRIEVCGTQQAVQAAHDGYAKTIAGYSDNADHIQQNKDFINGIAMWNTFFERTNKFYCARNDADQVVGVMRLTFSGGDIHIANVSAAPGQGAGGNLVKFAQQLAVDNKMTKVDLSTADEKLPGYYARFGFIMDTTGAKTGSMSWMVPKQ